MINVRLKKGKADFLKAKIPKRELVKKDGLTYFYDIEVSKERVAEICACKYNVDYSIRGCISQVPGPLLQEVIDNGGTYSKETLERFKREHKRLPNEKCFYCYARRHNSGRCIPCKVGEMTEADFEEYNPKVVRIGKNSEAGHPIYREVLINFLKLCKKYGSKVIFTGKMLDFDKKVAEFFGATGGIISYSLGANILEPGACSQGYTNNWRIKKATKYSKAGIPTALTQVCDITSSIDKNVEKGFALKDFLNADSRLIKRLLPIRLNSKKIIKMVTGREYNDIVYKGAYSPEGQRPLTGLEEDIYKIEKNEEMKPYFQKGSGELIPRYFHSDFKWFEDNLQVCGRVRDFEYCDRCAISSKKIKFPASWIIPVEYSEDKKKSMQWYRRKKKTKGQKSFKFN